MNSEMDGQMDGRMDGRTDSHLFYFAKDSEKSSKICYILLI